MNSSEVSSFLFELSSYFYCNFFSPSRSNKGAPQTMKHFLIALSALFISFSLQAQKIQVIDLETGEPIPFAKITCESSRELADIDGYFSLKCVDKMTTIQVTGYRDTTVLLSNQSSVAVQPLGKTLEEFTVSTVDEEANRIMSLAADYRKSNHPNGKSAYTYNAYSKFYVTLNPDAWAKIPDDSKDTSLAKMKSFFGSQHLFLMESTAKKFFEPPYREKEEITAYKVSGFNDPMFSTFASELQTFHFYENQFSIFGETFISPMAFGNTRRYVFQLVETLVSDKGDSTFHIKFRPQKDKNFEGLRGEIFINSRNYAIEKVIASPAEKKENFFATIIQEYQFKDGKWFPAKLSTEATFSALKLSEELPDSYMIAKGTTYVEGLQFDVNLKGEKFNAATVITNIDAGDKDSAHWNAQRVNQLSDKEKMTYHTIDSLGKELRFDNKLRIFNSLLSGKIPLGYVQLDLTRLFNYHEYEGYRFGLGLENSPKLMKRVTIGGYGAYGNRDLAWKYGAYMSALLSPNQFLKLDMRYQDDISERGGMIFNPQKDIIQLNTVAQEFYITQMDKQRLALVALNGYFRPTLGWRVGTSYQRVTFTKDYLFYNHGDTLTKFDQHEIFGELVWGIGDKVTFLAGKRLVTPSNKPHFRLAGTLGLKGLEQSLLNYQRIALEITERIQLRGAGLLQMRILGAKTFGQVPLFLTNAVSGTGGNWNLSVPNTFETMPASTFFNDQYTAFFFRYTTKSLKTKLKWTAPRLGVHYAMGTGTFSNAMNHSVPVQDMRKGYYETGAVLENVLILNNTGFGIGAFVPFGSLVSPDLSKTLTLKLAFTIVLN